MWYGRAYFYRNVLSLSDSSLISSEMYSKTLVSKTAKNSCLSLKRTLQNLLFHIWYNGRLRVKKELNKNFQFLSFLDQCVENGNIYVRVCTDLQGRFAIFAIYRVESFTRVSCIRVLAAIIVVYVFSCINIFFIILSIFCVDRFNTNYSEYISCINVKTYFVLNALY